MINNKSPETEMEVKTMKDMLNRIRIELEKDYFCPHYIKEKMDLFNRALVCAEDKTEIT